MICLTIIRLSVKVDAQFVECAAVSSETVVSSADHAPTHSTQQLECVNMHPSELRLQICHVYSPVISIWFVFSTYNNSN